MDLASRSATGTAEAATAALPAYPADRSCPFDPPPEYGRLRGEQPIARVRFREQDVWLITGYEQVRTVLRDPRFSSNPDREGFPTGTGLRRDKGQQRTSKARPLLTMDEPEHGVHRRMLIPTFGARRTEALRPRVEAVTNELIDAMTAAGDRADLMTAVALPLASQMICEILGLPDDGRHVFQDRIHVAVDPQRTPEDRMAAAAAIGAYLGEVIAAKHREPADDLLSRLVAEQVDTGVIDDEELASSAMAVLVAGYETTAQMIALGVLSLLERPESAESLREEPGMASGLVEELLRYWSIAHQGLYRAAVEDVEIDGLTIEAGDGVILSLSAANRDPEVFADPDTVDPARDSHGHLAFGHGAHRCLGEPLARLEVEVALLAIATRLPSLRLTTPVAELPYRHQKFLYGVDVLPVTW